MARLGCLANLLGFAKVIRCFLGQPPGDTYFKVPSGVQQLCFGQQSRPVLVLVQLQQRALDSFLAELQLKALFDWVQYLRSMILMRSSWSWSMTCMAPRIVVVLASNLPKPAAILQRAETPAPPRPKMATKVAGSMAGVVVGLP
jgi:hypothetical protein